MIRRFARALCAGIVVGVVLQESLWLVFGALSPGVSLNRALLAPPGSGVLVLATLCWALGGLTAGLMAALLGRGRLAGLAAGLAMAGSALLLLAHALDHPGGLLALAGTPLPAAIVGAGLARRVLDADRTAQDRKWLITLVTHGVN